MKTTRRSKLKSLSLCIIFAGLLSPLFASAGGRCNVDYDFRISDSSGNPLEGVSVSYIVKGGRQDAIRHYSKYKSRDRWSKQGSFGSNLGLNLGILEFRGDVITVELRFVKNGYKTVSRNDRVNAMEAGHMPTLRIEMIKDRKNKSQIPHQSTSRKSTPRTSSNYNNSDSQSRQTSSSSSQGNSFEFTVKQVKGMANDLIRIDQVSCLSGDPFDKDITGKAVTIKGVYNLGSRKSALIYCNGPLNIFKSGGAKRVSEGTGEFELTIDFVWYGGPINVYFCERDHSDAFYELDIIGKKIADNSHQASKITGKTLAILGAVISASVVLTVAFARKRFSSK